VIQKGNGADVAKKIATCKAAKLASAGVKGSAKKRTPGDTVRCTPVSQKKIAWEGVCLHQWQKNSNHSKTAN